MVTDKYIIFDSLLKAALNARIILIVIKYNDWKKHVFFLQTKNMKQCMQYESLYAATLVVHMSTQQSSWRERLLYTPYMYDVTSG